MDSRVATVFGGSGFVGRYVVRRLAQAGYTVRVAVRDTRGAAFLRPAGRVGQITPMYASLGNEATVARVLDGADVAVNLVGILAETRRGDFTRVHADGAGLVARTAARFGIGKLVQVSAIGASADSGSAYARSKAAGEAAVRAAIPEVCILRPSVVFGAEDRFFNLFGRLVQLLPFGPVLSGATRLQPVYVADVADAVLAGLDRPGTFELGGPQVMTMREIVEYVIRVTGRRKPAIGIPAGVAAIQARLGEWLPGKPLTRDQLVLLRTDNIVTGQNGLAQLGILPTPVDLVVPDYLGRFSPGGGRRDVPTGELRTGLDPLSS